MKRVKFTAIVLVMFMLLSISVLPAVFGQVDGGAGSGGHKGGNSGQGGGKGGGQHDTITPSVTPSDYTISEDGEEGEEGHSGSGKKGGSGGGGSKGGSGGKKGGTPVDTGKVTLEVTVDWPADFPREEVAVTLYRESEPTTKTTVNGVATFISEPSGDCQIVGEAISGFTIPEKEISLTGVNNTISHTLSYESIDVAVTGVKIVNGKDEKITKLEIIKGYPEQLYAVVEPANANDQELEWGSSNTDVVTVVDGLVKGVNKGEATITVKVLTDDGNFMAECDVNVISIESLDPDSLTAVQNEKVSLPKTVVGNLSNGNTKEFNVVWEDEDGTLAGAYYQVPLNPENPPQD